MRKTIVIVLVAVFVLMLGSFLVTETSSACGVPTKPPPPTSAPPPTAQPEATATPVPTPTATPVPTATMPPAVLPETGADLT